MIAKVSSSTLVQQADKELSKETGLKRRFPNGVSYLKREIKHLTGGLSPLKVIIRDLAAGKWLDKKKDCHTLQRKISNLNLNAIDSGHALKAYQTLSYIKNICLKIGLSAHLTSVQLENVTQLWVAADTKLEEFEEKLESEKKVLSLHHALQKPVASPSLKAPETPYYTPIASPHIIQSPAKRKSELTGLLRNTEKAILEHVKKFPEEPYADLSVLKTISFSKSKHPVNLEQSAYSHQGLRPTMEDAHFYKEISIDGHHGILTGVFDGHGGSEVSSYANARFAAAFAEALAHTKGNVRFALEEVFFELQKEIKEKNLHSGSTAIICYIDKATNLVYTATLADSEANIYREIDGEYKSIPLACIRDWASKNDAKRLAAYEINLWGDKFETQEEYEEELARRQELYMLVPSKMLRIWGVRNGEIGGVNVSRSLGDLDFAGNTEFPGIIQKPKITVFSILPGDVLILACDGLKDFVSEAEIAAVVEAEKEKGPEVLAKRLVESSLAKQDLYANDNVTVLAIKVY